MTSKNRNDWLNRRDELILLLVALIVALMFAPALLGVL
jgi:hypothetical protein